MIKCLHCGGYAYLKPNSSERRCEKCGADCRRKQTTELSMLSNLNLSDFHLLNVVKDMSYLHGRIIEAVARAEVGEQPLVQYSDIQSLIFTAGNNQDAVTVSDAELTEQRVRVRPSVKKRRSK